MHFSILTCNPTFFTRHHEWLFNCHYKACYAILNPTFFGARTVNIKLMDRKKQPDIWLMHCLTQEWLHSFAVIQSFQWEAVHCWVFSSVSRFSRCPERPPEKLCWMIVAVRWRPKSVLLWIFWLFEILERYLSHLKFFSLHFSLPDDDSGQLILRRSGKDKFYDAFLLLKPHRYCHVMEWLEESDKID